jgi:hypothetical protein
MRGDSCIFIFSLLRLITVEVFIMGLFIPTHSFETPGDGGHATKGGERKITFKKYPSFITKKTTAPGQKVMRTINRDPKIL